MQTQNFGVLHTHKSKFSMLNRMIDALFIWLSLFFSCNALQISSNFNYDYLALIAVLIYYLISEIFSLYRISRLETYGDIAAKILTTWFMVGLSLILIIFATKSSESYSRLAIGLWLIFTPAPIIFQRFCFFSLIRLIRKYGGNTLYFAILGNSESTEQLLSRIKAITWTGLVHFKNYNDLDELVKEVKFHGIDYVFITYPESDYEKIVNAVNALSDSTASVYLVPSILLADLIGSTWISLNNIPMIAINEQPFYGINWFIKKTLDLILSAIILVLIAPILLLIAIGIKLDSTGPIIFKQRRHGLNGEIIKVLKFRTMSVQEDGDLVIQAKKTDKRVTSFGRFLRKTSLDELPQFFNVLGGSMSIVGPRPHAVSHNEYYRKLVAGYMQRHRVKPGITGWAQVNGLRGETDSIDKMKARVEHDLYYINHWSIWLDIKIIILTTLTGFTGKKSY